jgi:hypothetical protein
MYSPAIARWASTDPAQGEADDPQSLNLYAYVKNNPTNFIDPSGAFTSDPPEKNDARGSGPFCGHHRNAFFQIGCGAIFVFAKEVNSRCSGDTEVAKVVVTIPVEVNVQFKVLEAGVTPSPGITLVSDPRLGGGGGQRGPAVLASVDFTTFDGGKLTWDFKIKCRGTEFSLSAIQKVSCPRIPHPTPAATATSAWATKTWSIPLLRAMRGPRGGD